MPRKFNPQDPKLTIIVGAQIKSKIGMRAEKAGLTPTQYCIRVFNKFFEVIEKSER